MIKVGLEDFLYSKHSKVVKTWSFEVVLPTVYSWFFGKNTGIAVFRLTENVQWQTVLHNCKRFSIHVFKKRFSQASISKIELIFEIRIIIFCGEVQYYVQLFRCQHRELHISKRNYEIIVVFSWKSLIFPEKNYKESLWFYYFLFFLKNIFRIWVWDWSLFGLIPFRIM